MKKQNSIITIYIIIFIIILAIVGASLFVFSTIKPLRENNIVIQKDQKNNNDTAEEILKKMEKDIQGTIIRGEKFNTYKNEEFGFEFQYDADMVIRERDRRTDSNTKEGPIFLTEIYTLTEDKQYIDDVALFHVVHPKFTDNTFWSSVENKSTVTVDNVTGTKYEYEFESVDDITIFLPIGENIIIVSSKKKYENIFNEILSTFKFLK